MKRKIGILILAFVMLFTSLSFIEGNNAEAAPKKGSTVTIKGQKYIYQGRFNHYFPLKYCRLVDKKAKKFQSFTNFVGGTSGFASLARKSGYGGALASSLYIANLGFQNNTKIYKTAARKGTGVSVSYDLYVPKTGSNYGLIRNEKIVYK
ncbi:hypothetical protein AAEQ20_002262 [Staphylococcus pseudintermedius]|nr:hypothetical protein [Staphylococcus pseudintermedius]EGQ4366364.1 hypothetical protein [Staphylococcus pseudintermedius]EHD0843965.1 hypothetical protein [Staphylococcus pseudintermedius]EII2710056.1 hypothetical protein [Staphylococcus pseudintermedius]ELH1893595.1 hypothetical protein [Staphylococcus pseudintermedius]ELI4028729.1 hypothetical protein [Staphylococcus pseudintermedius]